MLLKNRELTIRTTEKKDAPFLFRWWNDGAVMAHAGFPEGLHISMEKILLQIEGGDGCERLMIEKNGVPIGEMSYRPKGNAAEIGIKICEKCEQEKGYGKRLLTLLISALFQLGFEKIVLDTNLSNTRAQRVYEELGFRKLRVNRDCWTDQLGRLQSAVDYEMNRGELIAFP